MTLFSKPSSSFRLKTIFLFILAATFPGCGGDDPWVQQDYSIQPAPAAVFQAEKLEIDGDLKSFKAAWEQPTVKDGVQYVTLVLTSQTPAPPPKFTVKWTTPSVNIDGFWTPNLSLDKATYYRAEVTTRAVRYAPVIALYNNAGQNRFTFAITDTLNRVKIGTYLKEEDVKFHHYISFFNERTPAVKEYRVTLRVDTRDLDYSETLRGVSQWWESLDNHTPAPVPDAARQPMYSTWYSFHQNITADEVVKQCEMSKKLGFEAVIVDDGWQTLDSQRGYAFTGDWKPERIPDMKGFVQRVHDLDMKFLLWYSVPLVGEKAENYSRFKGKYLWYWKGQGAYVLDPRYPEVREFIISTYIDAMKAWNLDGFKLDFMGMFRPDEHTVFTAEGGRDYASIDAAVDVLMTDIMSRLRALKPDIMIEFRQPYIGPLMRKYGNMFRAADCPNMALVNRARTTDIRLLCGNTAAHSDMFVWHDDEPVEAAALQILNILFSVPQLSVKLDNFSDEHNRMIKFWINYWKANREVLLDGEFLPENPHNNYPVIRAETVDKTVIAVYNDRVISLGESASKTIDIVNAKESPYVILDTGKLLGQVNIMVFDCMGQLKDARLIEIGKGVCKLHVPPSGLLSISR